MINFTRFDTPNDVVVALAESIKTYSDLNRPVHISLSGGSTPKLLFKVLAQAPYAEQIQWKNLHFWWGDERCVAPDDAESNYGQAAEILFSHIEIPAENIHRIIGENNPEQEAQRFAQEMKETIPMVSGFPQFDWILLGMGEDGHTASLFPNQTDFTTNKFAIVAIQPQSGQQRVSKSARLIENALRITYLVLGDSKATLLKEINDNASESLPYPAAKIQSQIGITEWFLDSAAAKALA